VTKFNVSSVACHKIGLTVAPVCGPTRRSDSFLAKPSTVQIVASVSISFDSLVDACWALALSGCAGDRVSVHAARAKEKLAAMVRDER